MSTLRVTLLIADPGRADDARAIRDVLARFAPYCGVQTHLFASIDELNEESPQFARGVAASLWSDVVLFLSPPREPRGNAALIALRERSGFTEAFAQPERVRAWLTPNGRRSLYALGSLPGAFGVLALALEYGVGDPDGAQRLRHALQFEERLVIA
jgi:hypothetical protein